MNDRAKRPSRAGAPLPPPRPGTGLGAGASPTSRAHGYLKQKNHRYPAVAAVVVAVIGALFLWGFLANTTRTRVSGHLWWKETTTSAVPFGERAPALVIAILCFVVAVALAAWAARAVRSQNGNVSALAGARSARRARESARVLASRDPNLARELKIGRPDLAGEYDDGGLVDLNSAPPQVLVEILGVSSAEADRIISVRSEFGRVRTVEDMLALAGIDSETVSATSERAICL